LAARPVPRFDLLLLGVGEDGHIASIFPDHPLVSPEATVSAVCDSPKPPATRITLTLETINSAAEVWMIASGEAKAPAVRSALFPGAKPRLAAPPPAATAHGLDRTIWLLDSEAASLLPRD
jgi:6-phosphogluconolactonase